MAGQRERARQESITRGMAMAKAQAAHQSAVRRYQRSVDAVNAQFELNRD